MKRLVELPVDVGGGEQQTVRVEIEQVEDGLADVSRPGRLAARAARSLGEMLAGVRPVAESFVEGFGGMEHAPDEIGLEFGLSLSAEADVVVSTTAAAANFKVTLTWRKPEPERPTPDPAGSSPEPAAPSPGPPGPAHEPAVPASGPDRAAFDPAGQES